MRLKHGLTAMLLGPGLAYIAPVGWAWAQHLRTLQQLRTSINLASVEHSDNDVNMRDVWLRKKNGQQPLLVLMTALVLLIPQSFAASFETHEWKTSKGARVVFHRAPDVPMLDINVAFAAGSAYDEEKWGLSALTTRLLDQGNNGLQASVFAEKFTEMGAQYACTTNQDMIQLSLRTLTQPAALEHARSMFALLINHPDFPNDAFLREKNQQLLLVKQHQESAETLAQEAFFQALYEEHPYAHPVNGNQASVSGLTLKDVRHFYQQYIVSQNAIIVLVGDIDIALAHQLAERILQDLPKGQAAPAIPNAPPLTHAKHIEIKHPGLQTALRLGQLGITHQNKDYFAFQVGNYILGAGSMSARLTQELRNKNGLTYGVTSTFSAMPGTGPFIISLSTQHKQAQTAIALARKTLADFVKTGPTENELIAAKQYLTGSFPWSLAGNRNIANMLVRMTFYHLPQNFLNAYIANINAVSVADIKKAFQNQMDLNHLLQINVGRS